MKRILCATICIITFLLTAFCGCSRDIEFTEDKFNFKNYQSEEIFDIEQVKLKNKLAKSCISYKFNYLSDGYKIQGYISIPLEVAESQSQWKCLVYNRGGNSKIGLLADEDTAKLCSATNRIVIATQYRGAGGNEGVDEFGGSDLNDVIKLIDLCESQFSFVDMDDFAVLGVSRGGMMTYMTAEQDDRVKKIIAISAVSDLFQAYDEREDMQKILYNCIGGAPKDIPVEYEKRSAIYWTDEINIPVLIIHSKKDKQVSFAQAEDIYDKLKLTNQDVSFVIRDDNVHGLIDDDAEPIIEFLEN